MREAPPDRGFMAAALALAQSARDAGEVPVGAIVVIDGEIVAQAGNAPIGESDPTAHAEIRALRAACRAIGNYRLAGATLYATLEPCAMCAGALVHARVERLVFGAKDPKSGACGSVFDICSDARLNHRVAVTGGVLAEEAGELLKAFFRERRR